MYIKILPVVAFFLAALIWYIAKYQLWFGNSAVLATRESRVWREIRWELRRLQSVSHRCSPHSLTESVGVQQRRGKKCCFAKCIVVLLLYFCNSRSYKFLLRVRKSVTGYKCAKHFFVLGCCTYLTLFSLKTIGFPRARKATIVMQSCITGVFTGFCSLVSVCGTFIGLAVRVSWWMSNSGKKIIQRNCGCVNVNRWLGLNRTSERSHNVGLGTVDSFFFRDL